MQAWRTSAAILARKLWQHLVRAVWLSLDDEVRLVDLSPPPVAAAPTAPEVVIRPVEEADLDAQPRERADHWRRRLPTCRGLVALRDGRACAWAWVTRERRAREGDPPFLYPVTPPPGWAYMFDVATLESCAGLGMGTRIVVHALDAAAADGAKRAMLTMDAGNERMRRLTDRLGFRTAGRLTYRRVLGIAFRDVSALRAWEVPSEPPPSPS